MAVQAPQLALDGATRRAEIQMAPPLDTPRVDAGAELAAARADSSSAPEPHHDGDALAAKTDVDDKGSGRRRSRFNAVLTRTSSSS
jgi:hypothetical protein